MQFVTRSLSLLLAVLVWSDLCSANLLFRITFPDQFSSLNAKCRAHCAKKENPGEFDLPCLAGCRLRVSPSNPDEDKCSDGCQQRFPIPQQTLSCQFGCQYRDDSKKSEDSDVNAKTEHGDSDDTKTEIDTMPFSPRDGEEVIGVSNSFSIVTVNGRGFNIKRTTLIVKGADEEVREVTLPPKISPVVPEPDNEHERRLFMIPLYMRGHAVPSRSFFDRERVGITDGIMQQRSFFDRERVGITDRIMQQRPFFAVENDEEFPGLSFFRSMHQWEIVLMLLLIFCTFLLVGVCCNMMKRETERSELVAATPLKFDGNRHVLSVSDLIGDDLPPKYQPIARTESSDESPQSHDRSSVSERTPLV